MRSDITVQECDICLKEKSKVENILHYDYQIGYFDMQICEDCIKEGMKRQEELYKLENS